MSEQPKPNRYVYGTDPEKCQLSTIGEFKLKVSQTEEYKAFPQESEAYLTEYNCHRFLAARDYNIKKALSLMKNHLKWRFQVYKPSTIKAADMEVYARKGAVQSSPRGFDKHGRPILILDDSKDNVKISNSKEKQREAMKHLVFHMERSVAKFDDKVRRFVVFINLEDFTLRSAPNFATTRETASIFSSQYPETLGLAVLYKAPWAFTQFFNGIKYFIDPITRKKIQFISGSCKKGSKNDRKLCELLGDNWKEITGVGFPKKAPDMSPGYDHEMFWPQIVREEQENNQK